MSYEEHPTEYCPVCEEEYKVHEPDPSCICGWDPRTGTEHKKERGL
jgi:hypothetical protein